MQLLEKTKTPPDLSDEARAFAREACEGLSRKQKTLPCKYFYDERGSLLFDLICGLEEYYPTRTEMAIMKQSAPEMAEALGEGCLLIEYGSGSSIKTRILLDSLSAPAGYVPIDISCGHLARSARSLAEAYPHLRVLPVCADYTASFTLPEPPGGACRKAVYFPGSTIGNFERGEAQEFLRKMSTVAGGHGGLLIGVDLKKDATVLERAYDDAMGITAAFNMNILARMNRELGTDFDLGMFRHHVFYNQDKGRVEMHLQSLAPQSVHVNGETFTFRKGETIHTENSHKYTVQEFAEMAQAAGWTLQQVWTDPANLFSVQYLTAT